MDPKAGQILDPKLKEAYDRVMGASIPQAAPPAPPPVTHTTAATPLPHMEPPKPVVDAHPLINPLPKEEHAAASSASPQSATASPTAPAPGAQPHGTMSFSAAYVAPHGEKKAPISGTLLIIAGMLFLAVYTLFWMKWFGMAIPFLP
jgi:outer membrane biosynthesis protein TonB